MGTLVLVVVLVTEAAFAVYCIATRTRHETVRSYIRIAALAAFVILAFSSVIQWSFRWYGLALLLFIWAALGAWRLLARHAEKGPYSAGGTVGKAAGMLLLVFVALIPELVFPQYRPPQTTGGYDVATVNYTYTDKSRIEGFTNTGENRRVNVEFWYPKKAGGRHPLIVFSHGAFGIKMSNSSTFRELASNGYVVCSIDHPYHALFTIGADHRLVRVDRSFYQEIVDVNEGKYDEATVFALERKWMQLRTADINFVLNTILEEAESGDSASVYGLVDGKRIGLMGHSLGGASSALVARQRTDIGAVVNLDADLQGEYLRYSDGKYALNDTTYPVPILTILADDVVRLIDAVPDANSVVALEHVTATAPHAYEVHIKGTDHMSVTDLPLVSPLLTSMITKSVKKAGGGAPADKRVVIEKMNSLVLAFFNAYLKKEGTFAVANSM